MKDSHRIIQWFSRRFLSGLIPGHGATLAADGDRRHFLLTQPFADRALHRGPVGHPDRTKLLHEYFTRRTAIDVKWQLVSLLRFSQLGY